MSIEGHSHQTDSLSPWILGPVGKIRVASPEPTRKHQALKKEVHRMAGEITLATLAPMVPEVLYAEPEIDEDTIKDHVSEGDKHIAALKTYNSSEAAHFRNLRRTLPQETSTLDFLRTHAGKLHLSYANDVTTIVQINGEKVIEYKIDKGSTKEQVLAHLYRTVGLKSQEDPFVHIDWQETLALHEAATDISVVRQHAHELLLHRPTKSFLNALVYGLQDPNPDHAVDAQTHKQFLRLYTNGTEYSRPDHSEKPARHSNNWAGWTPESGMPLENLLRVNGARPGDTLPFIELLVTQVDGLRPTQNGFEGKIIEAIKDVRGKARDFRYVLRVLQETIAEHPDLGSLDAFHGDPTFRELADNLTALQAQNILEKSWTYTGRTKEISGEKRTGDPQILEQFALGMLGMSSSESHPYGIL